MSNSATLLASASRRLLPRFMQFLPKILLTFSVMLAALVNCYCRADDFVGVWHSETNRASVPGRTNTFEGFERVEFFKDGSVNIASVWVDDGKWRTNVSFSGTYTLITTSRASLKVASLNVVPSSKSHHVTVPGSIIGGELEIPKFIASVIPEFAKYRRTKR